MNEEVIDCIPSATLRQYIKEHPIEFSIMQEATIVSEFAKRKKQLRLLRGLLEKAETEGEKLLFASYINDMENRKIKCGWWSNKTHKIYQKYFPHRSYPFSDVCNFPVLFKAGDVFRDCRNNTCYCIGLVPVLPKGHCDFSDECYLCYPLSFTARCEHDLLMQHFHTNVCYAESASIDMLTRSQMKSLKSIRKVLRDIGWL